MVTHCRHYYVPKRISTRISTNQQWVTWPINCYKESWISSSVWQRKGNTIGLNTNCWSWPTFYQEYILLVLPMLVSRTSWWPFLWPPDAMPGHWWCCWWQCDAAGGSVMLHVAPWYWVRRLIGTASQSPTLPVETIKRGTQTVLATTSNMIDKFEKQDLNWDACVIEICSRCLHKVVL